MSALKDNYQTDGCTSPECSAALGGASSLNQGQQFAAMTKTFHGGRRQRQSGGAAPFPGEFSQTLPQDMHQAANIAPLDAAFNELPNFIGKYGMGGGSRKNRKASRKGRKASRKGRKASRNASRKGRKASRKGRKGRKASRKNRKASRKNRKASRKNRKASRKGRKGRKASRKQRGGMAPVGAPSMILTPAEEPAAFLNPQWYNENQVVPSFKGPSNPYAEQQYANQIRY